VVLGNGCVRDEDIGRRWESFDNSADNVGDEMETAMDRVLPKNGYSGDIDRVVGIVGHSSLALPFLVKRFGSKCF
jgi:hypothetical protein